MSKERQDSGLKERLSQCPHIRIMEGYIPCIEEIYQMSDVYFFPVKTMGHCIDIPLSCLEAAACNKPVITTEYGEMSEFSETPGFYFIDRLTSTSINEMIVEALEKDVSNVRDYVIDYNYDGAIDLLCT